VTRYLLSRIGAVLVIAAADLIAQSLSPGLIGH
jgi:hypothetical protein